MSLDFISLEVIQEIAQQYGYWAVFLGILLENLGLPIPGETVTLAGGFLAGNDQLNYWLVLTDAALGATLGGTIGYWLGRWGGWSLLLKAGRLVRIQEPQIVALRAQFTENSAKAVFLGRFIALLRVFASPLAGMTEMPYAKFMLYNTLGAVAWASVMVTLSYVAGQFVPLEQLVSLASKFAVVTLLAIAAWIGIPLWLETRKAKQEMLATPSTEEPISDSLAGGQ